MPLKKIYHYRGKKTVGIELTEAEKRRLCLENLERVKQQLNDKKIQK